MNHFVSSAYGLFLSADTPLPGLPKSAPGKIDLQIWLKSKPDWAKQCAATAAAPFYTSPKSEDGSGPALRVEKLAAGTYFRLQYGDGTGFVLDAEATRLWAEWSAPSTLEDVTTYLLGPVLGFVLRLRGVTSLHASSVGVDGRAIALLGPAGSGKSTTAAAFARLDYPVLSDDIAALESHGENYLVRPGYPRVCLWPEAVEALVGSRTETLPRLTPTWDKCYLPLDDQGPRFQPTPLPLAAIYLLGPRTSDPPAPCIEPVRGQEALVELVRNTYMNYLLDKEERAREFQFLGKLLARVSLRRVRPHCNPRQLEGLCRALLDDFHSLLRRQPSASPASAA